MKYIVIPLLFAASVVVATFTLPGQNDIPHDADVRTTVVTPDPKPLALPESRQAPDEKAHPKPESTVVRIPIEATTTVIDAMQRASTRGDITFKATEHPGLGSFVYSIDGIEGKNGWYWFLYIDGVRSSLGATRTTVAPESLVEWRYENGY